MYRTLFILILVIFGLNACTQWHRDSLRYGKTVRGTETYEITTEQPTEGSTKTHDSLTAAVTRNAQEIRLYKAHISAYRNNDISAYDKLFQIEELLHTLKAENTIAIDDFKEIETQIKTARSHYLDAVSTKINIDTANQQLESDLEESVNTLERVGVSFIGYKFPSIASSTNQTGLGLIWPISSLAIDTSLGGRTSEEEFDENGKLKKRTTVNNDQLIRALSSSASMVQMRDLLTEPAFPSLLPTKREVELGCLPPPESAAFEASTKLHAAVNRFDETTGNSTRQDEITTSFGESVVKMFEESERTLFLQYALFRLCEMSINAPSGFRNVYPVVIHDIVRRTAEMTELANKEAEVRKRAEAEALKSKYEKETQTAATVTQETVVKAQEARKAADEAAIRRSKTEQETRYKEKLANCIEKKLNADPPVADEDTAATDCEKVYKSIKPSAVAT